MADAELVVSATLNDGITEALKRISNNLANLTNNFEDLAGILKDVSAGMKAATTSSTDSMDKLAKSSDKAAETVTKNFSSIVRSSQAMLSKLQPEINKTVSALEKLIKPSMGTPLTSGQSNLADFSGLRSGALSAIGNIERVKAEIEALYPAARKGSEVAAEGIKSLGKEYAQLTAKLKDYQTQLQSGSAEFQKIQGPKNSMLGAMGYKQITLNDIFPTSEQQKFEQLQQRMSQATFKSIQQGAVRDTLNGFLSTNLQLKQVDDNVLRIATHLPRMRYALYDVANTATFTGAALLAIPVATIAIAASFERDFADVERTVDKAGTGVGTLKQELIALSQTIPVSFKDLTRIGELAGQLDIAKGNVAAFTETVAKFSATTDVTTTEAATAFGRISQLVKGVGGQYDRLGSSIAKVGVNSVATESQIIRITQQISSIGNLAGFTADQIVGLAGSLASVGTTPELSRGLITRLFTEINGAVSGANDNLDTFAKLSGQTSDQFRKQWSEGGGAYQIVQFLRGLDSEGIQAEQTLRTLNIASVRDIPTVLKLASSYKEVAKSLSDAKTGFDENTELERQYGIITNTLSEKINILVNNFQALIATAGSATGPIGLVVDGLITLVKTTKLIINNPINGFFISTALAITSLIGVAGLLGGVLSRVSAGLFGVVEAQVRLREIIGNARVAYADSALSIRSVAASQAEAASSGGMLSGVLKQTAIDTKANYVGMRAFASSIKEVVLASAAFKAVLSTTLITAGITIALTTISMLFEEISKKMKTSSDRAKELFGDLSSLASALKQDAEAAKAGTAALATYTRSIDNTTYSVGKNTAELIANTIATDDNIKKVLEAARKLKSEGGPQLDEGKFVALIAKGDTEAAIKLYKDYAVKIGEFQRKFLEVPVVTQPEFLKPQPVPDFLKELQDQQGQMPTFNTEGFGIVGTNLQAVTDGANAVKTALEEAGLETGLVNSVMTELGYATDDASSSLENAADSLEQFKQAFNDAFGDVDAIDKFYSSLQKLQSGVQENGNAFDLLSSSGTTNLLNLRDALSASVVAAESMGGNAVQGIAYVFAQLAAQGVDTAMLLARVAGMSINGVTISANEVSAAMGKIPANTFKNIGTSAGGAAKQVKTLADYANDLSSVFSRSFDIRFGGQSTLDDITGSWRDMAEASENANQKIKDLRADLDSLTADKALQEYFLSVANAYGDTLAAAQIQAKINKINNQLTSTNEDLSDAQNDANKSLVGNSNAAIRNRSEILNMVKAYQDHLKALAASGMGQDELSAKAQELRADFYAQAQAMGYNTGELGTYALAFDDMNTIIGQVPRDITVDANVDPALQALNEFVAKAASSGSSAGGAFGSSFLDGLTTAIEDNKPTTPGGYLGIPGLMEQTGEVPFYLRGVQNGTQYVTGVKTGIDTTTPTLTPSFEPWSAASQNAANKSRDAWLNTLPQVPQFVVNNVPKFNTWSGAGATAAQNTATSWQGTAGNIPTQVDNQTTRMSNAFSALSRASKGGWNAFAPSSGAQLSNLFKWYADGGYTGSGAKYEPAGIVHKGEYVVPKAQVNQTTRLPYFMEARPQYASGGYVSAPPAQTMGGMVSLSPEDRALLRSIGGSGEVVLYANNEAIARSANAGNRAIVATGGLP
jgi:TP901 family phage tail tape measure protein